MTLQFEPISLEKQQDYLKILARCPQVASDYSFMNIWAWAEDYGLTWAWSDDCVWIRQSRPEVLYWAPVGPWSEIDWPTRLSEASGDPTIFIRIPNQLVEIWQTAFTDRAAFEEERGHWDYVYSVNELVDLKGNRFHKKKNLLNQFIKKYDYTYVPFAPELIDQAMALQESWCTWRDCESSDVLAAENHAIFRVLNNWGQLNGTLGGALMVDGSMVAYTVAEALTPQSVVIHFEKGDTRFKGVYQAINQMFLAHSARDFLTVNREQDLNDEGLRKSKLSYNPTELLHKYRVTIGGAIQG
ncbi:MAG: phosphatidylglycerol lysyltransferase domain-containing protein [Deltaproteobacteria bacterium]|nr:phosphatidylglycerol lysyltransferase domain-containing protein [Deltaproteobacteria bacterium]